MAQVTLQAEKRDVLGKKANDVREQGKIPAVIYGRGVENQSISVPLIAFEKAYKVAGESTLLDLTLAPDQSVRVLIQDVQWDPLTDKPIHVDFHQVSMTDKMTVSIPLKFSGEAKAVKELGGTFVRNLDEITVRCLPQDLVHEIMIDLSPLATFDDAILIKDISIPKGMEIVGSHELIVASVMAPMSEEEIKKLDEEGSVSDVSKVEKVDTKKKEEEEPAK